MQRAARQSCVIIHVSYAPGVLPTTWVIQNRVAMTCLALCARGIGAACGVVGQGGWENYPPPLPSPLTLFTSVWWYRAAFIRHVIFHVEMDKLCRHFLNTDGFIGVFGANLCFHPNPGSLTCFEYDPLRGCFGWDSAETQMVSHLKRILGFM